VAWTPRGSIRGPFPHHTVKEDLRATSISCSDRVRKLEYPAIVGRRLCRPRKPLGALLSKLSCCEINSLFYRPHKNETWIRWAQSVPADFRFSVKMPKSITHVARLACSSDVLSAFLHQIAFLGEKLGPILVQLPPSLEFEDSVTTNFLTLLRKSYSGEVVLEPRHLSWFNDRANDLLTAYHIARVAADPACVPAAMDPGGSSSLAYFRLHGSPRRYYSPYSAEFLDQLFLTLQNLAATARVWCVFDNTASGSAIQNALALKARLHQ